MAGLFSRLGTEYLFISILISLLVQWLTESRFGKTKFGLGFPIEIRSLIMSAGIRKRSFQGQFFCALQRFLDRTLKGPRRSGQRV
jgi:hypothetical protein